MLSREIGRVGTEANKRGTLMMGHRSLIAGLSCFLWVSLSGIGSFAVEPSPDLPMQQGLPSKDDPPKKDDRPSKVEQPANEEQPAKAEPETLRVVSFSLINTKTQKPIKDFEKVTKNDKISISKLPVQSINVAANIKGKVGSVRFLVPQKKLKRVENTAPFSMAGDIYGRFLPWKIEPGKYTLVAVPYTEANGRGDRGEYLRIDVEFVE
ncbi:MAG: hypothetical protein AAGI63_18110 [Planctomycetota bacterium]